MTPAVANAERVRVAGRVLEEVARALTTGEAPADQALRVAATALAKDASTLWGALAVLAGPGYLESLQEPHNKLFRAANRLAEIQCMAASMDGAQLVGLIEDPKFAYRDVALAVALIRALLGFATPAEMALTLPVFPLAKPIRHGEVIGKAGCDV